MNCEPIPHTVPEGRYPTGVFERLVSQKTELRTRLQFQASSRPFETRVAAGLQPREQRRAEESGGGASVDARIRDHLGKTRLTKVRPSTSMGEIIEWYGPKDRKAVIMDENTGIRLGNSTQVHQLSPSTVLALRIVPRPAQ